MGILQMQPLLKEPVLFIDDKKIMVVADLHIGIESELRGKGINPVAQTKKMINHLYSICEKNKPKEIVLLGDIKHNIPSSTIAERRDVKLFLEKIVDYGKIHLIPGNHDGNIHKLCPKNIIIHPSDGFILKDIGFIHGHRWPNKDLMQSKQIIIGHTHPTIMLTDRLNHKTFEPCWLKGGFIKKMLKKRYPDAKNPKVIVIPAFNPLCGGIAANKDGITGPLGKILNTKQMEVFLLDGTSMGFVKDID
jgi:hypothetical protein